MNQAKLNQPKFNKPKYSESFLCIGSSCEDTCCKGFTVAIDQAAHEKFQTLPASPLRTLIDANTLVTRKNDDGSSPATFATIRLTASQHCPMLSAERLCGIQAEYGDAFLPHACATYPRIIHSIGGIEEEALSLSCPEAARLVLLNPGALNPALLDSDSSAITEPVSSELDEGRGVENVYSLQSWFWSIRKFVLGLVRNRTYPLWQRMFLLGVFCRQMDSIATKGLQCGFREFLREFEGTVASGALRTTMNAIPVDSARQLDVVLQLAGMLLGSCHASPRFFECVQAFTVGIGNGPGATFESLTAQYARAHDRAYAPFFARHPYIMENYLLNTIFRCQFPFGREGMRPGASPSMAREYALLTAQFALMKGLLIGVAGFHGDAFSTDHVVHTVQSASKHFEHHAEFLNRAYGVLTQSRLEGDMGLAILLQNAEAAVPAVPRAALIFRKNKNQSKGSQGTRRTNAALPPTGSSL